MGNVTNFMHWNKIWFSVEPSKFISENIKEKLKELHPLLEIGCHFNLFYSSSLLNNEGLNDFESFKASDQNHQNLHFIDIDSPEFVKGLKNEKEKKLYDLAKLEIKHIKDNTGGNPAAASDIIRVLSPCYLEGIYTDFDIDIDVYELVNHIDGKIEGLYFPCDGINSKSCNDVIFIPSILTVEEQFLLDQIHLCIIDEYILKISNYEPNEIEFKGDLNALSKAKEFINKIKLLEKTEKVDMIKFRFFICKELDSLERGKDSNALINYYIHLYKMTVTYVTGPGIFNMALSKKNDEQEVFFDMAKLFEIKQHPLTKIASSQLFSKKNDASWFPTCNKISVVPMTKSGMSMFSHHNKNDSTDSKELDNSPNPKPQ